MSFFIPTANAHAISFWSHFASHVYDSSNGVALLFHGAHPFQDMHTIPVDGVLKPVDNLFAQPLSHYWNTYVEKWNVNNSQVKLSVYHF